MIVDAFWSRDAIWYGASWSTLVQAMAYCLTAPSHYLNQYWHWTRIAGIHSSGWLQQSFKSPIPRLFEMYTFESTATPPSRQWVNSTSFVLYICAQVMCYLPTYPNNAHVMHGHRLENLSRHDVQYAYPLFSDTTDILSNYARVTTAPIKLAIN